MPSPPGDELILVAAAMAQPPSSQSQRPRPQDWSLISQAEVMALLRNRGYPDPLLKRPAAHALNSLHAYLAANLGLTRALDDDQKPIDARGTWSSAEAFPNAADAQRAVAELRELGYGARGH